MKTVPSSYIIYADDSTVKSRNGITGVIDYSGTNATTVIQSAINSLMSGGEIFIKAGTYVLYSTIYYNNNNIRMIGEGLSTKLNFADGSIGDMIDFRKSTGTTNENAILQHMFIDGNKDNCPSGGAGIRAGGNVGSYATRHRVLDVVVQNCKGCGIDARYVYNFHLTRSSCAWNYGGGLLINHVQGSEIYFTRFHENNRRGIFGNAYEVYIVGVIIDLTSELDYGGQAIYITPAPFDVLISSCEFQFNAREAIWLENRTVNGHGFRIIDNIFKGNSYKYSGSLAVIRIDNARTSYTISNVVVANNIVTWGGGYAQNKHFLKIANTQRMTVTNNIIDPAAITTGFIDGIPSASDNIHHNIGYTTESNVLSGTFAIDSTGIKTVTIPHDLDITPAVQDCYLTAVENTLVDDWAYNMLKIVSTDFKNVIAKINISQASKTIGATARLALRVGNS